METLSNLSDEQLRLRLSQYGFPNMPVTDTTRKVLVKKLQKAIDGETMKGRRETVAVSKFSSDEEPEKVEKSRAPRKDKTPNRRATVATTKSESFVNGASGLASGNGVSKVMDPPARRASRNTPAKEKVVEVPQFVPFPEDTDDDIPEIQTIKRRSTSRTTTPTMGKSEIVRTSYGTNIKPVEENSGEEIYSVDDEEEEILPPSRKPVLSAIRRHTSSTATTMTMKVQDNKTQSKLGRATLGTSYTPTYTYSREEDEDKEELNTPYLSTFANRLSTLKAEPLDAGMEKYRKTLPQTEYKAYERPSSYHYSRTVSTPAPKAAAKQGGFIAGLSKMFDTLDRQYNFYTILYVVLIIMLIVALFVVFM